MRERFTRRDIRFLLLCLLILALTIWFSARFFYRAFPEASIDFVVTRAQSQHLAEQFVASRHHRLEGYRHASAFQFDETAKTFLERELGLDRANQIMGRRVRLWRWSHRWFRPLEKEEYRVDITPKGETVSFQRLLPESAPGANLSSDQARSQAETFLRAMQRDPAALDFVETSSLTRPARTDHVFTWKERDFDIKDATYRLEVTVLGDGIGGYSEYLKVPDTWLRDYERLRSRNQAAQSIDSVIFVLLAAGALVVLIIRVRRQDIRWRRAAAFGAVTAVLFFLSTWNAQPMAEFSYPTTDSWSNFLARRLLQTLLGALGAGGGIILLTAAAEPLYREFYPRFLSVGNLMRWRGVRTKRFFLGSVLGFTLAGFFVAYQTGFYLLAYRLGAWSPADVPYDDLLNTRFPWLFVLFGGFLPAVSEEFLFRMFSIPFLNRLFRFTWLAVILSGFIWGFGHAGYPQQPFYIRGLEVGLGGVLLGWIMLRWGILPTLVWHYSVDALYSALLLMRSHNLYFVLSGAASAGVLLLPLLIAWIAYVRGKGFEPETELTNEREGTARAPVEEEVSAGPAAEFPYRPWSGRRRMAAVVLLGAAGVVLLWRGAAPGLSAGFALTASQARAIADEFLRGLGLSPQAFRSVIYTESSYDPEVPKYFLERRPLSYFKDACLSIHPLYTWTVRYYKPLEKEEVRISIDPRGGKLVSFEDVLPEDQPGADLPESSARTIASRYLAGRGLDLQILELKETKSEKKKARRDYDLTWEAKPGDPRNLDEAHYRVRVEIGGDRVTQFDTGWKLPEAFLRERERRSVLYNTLFALRIIMITAAVVVAAWILIQYTRTRLLRWPSAVRVAVPLSIIAVLALVLNFPLFYRGYSTAISLETFRAQLIAVLAVGAVGLTLLLLCCAALIVALRPDALAVFLSSVRRRLGIDALLAAGAALSLSLLLDRFRDLLFNRFHSQVLLSLSAPDIFAGPAPAVSAVASAVRETLMALALLVVIAHIVRAVLRRRWLAVPIAMIAVAAFVPGEVHTAGEFTLQYAILLLSAGLLLAFCVWFARDNYLAYAMAAWSWALGRRALEFLAQPSVALQRQGWLIVAVLASSLLCAIAPAFRPLKFYCTTSE